MSLLLTAPNRKLVPSILLSNGYWLSLEIMYPGMKLNTLLHSHAQFTIAWRHTFTPPYVFVVLAWAQGQLHILTYVWRKQRANTGLFKMIAGVLTTCHKQYTWDRSICVFYLTEQHSKFLLHTLYVLYMCTLCDSTNINTIIEFVPNCL